MKSLKNRILNCTACELHKTRNHAVWGEGNTNAEIILIGEAPGYDEDRTGRPFGGKSGQLLDKILAASGFTRSEHVFMSNVIRCRPPGNRIPSEFFLFTCKSVFTGCRIRLFRSFCYFFLSTACCEKEKYCCYKKNKIFVHCFLLLFFAGVAKATFSTFCFF